NAISEFAHALSLRESAATSTTKVGGCRTLTEVGDNHLQRKQAPGYAGGVTDYRPPMSDLLFSLEHVVDYPGVAALPGFDHADLDTVRDVLAECADFMSEVVAPTNRDGDTIGARRQPDGSVTTPESFKGAYKGYVDAGWGG